MKSARTSASSAETWGDDFERLERGFDVYCARIGFGMRTRAGVRGRTRCGGVCWRRDRCERGESARRVRTRSTTRARRTMGTRTRAY